MRSFISLLRSGPKFFVAARRSAWCAALAGAAVLAAALPAAASGLVKVVTKYEVTIAGVPLGSIKFFGNIDDESYTLTGRGESSRLIDLISEVKAEGKSAGALAGVRVLPESYKLRFKADDNRQRVDMRFSGGGIEQLAAKPALKSSPSRVPVEASHRVGVIDPISALIMPLPEGALDGEAACERRLPIFDGRYRYDIVLSHKRTATAALPGKSAERTRLFVCKVKYEPVAGHKPKRKSTRYWQENDGMEIWLMPVAEARLFVPYRAVAPSRIGPVVLSLSKLKVSERERQAAITPDR